MSQFTQQTLVNDEANGMAKLEGTIVVDGLRPHRGLIVSLCFYRVSRRPHEAGGECQFLPMSAAEPGVGRACLWMQTRSERTAMDSRPPKSP